MRKLNRTAKLAFYNARQRKGDTARLAETTSVNQDVANAMYNMSRRRMKTIELVG